MRVF
ncbi:hypothetical protein D020_1131A, partial [Vibrio parahaemolyticus SBR10290]|jgi:hypothetical protein